MSGCSTVSAFHIWGFFCCFISFHSFFFCCFFSSFLWRPPEFTRQLSAMTEEKIWAKLISLEKVDFIGICLILVICGRTDRINENLSWPLKPLRSKAKTFSNFVYLTAVWKQFKQCNTFLTGWLCLILAKSMMGSAKTSCVTYLSWYFVVCYAWLRIWIWPLFRSSFITSLLEFRRSDLKAGISPSSPFVIFFWHEKGRMVGLNVYTEGCLIQCHW